MTKARLGAVGKQEIVRRLQRSDILKVLRHRYGTTLPDDDAGQEDLFVLMSNTAQAPMATRERLRNDLELWAPWLVESGHDEEYLDQFDVPRRGTDGRWLGQQLGVDSQLWALLGLRFIKPHDMSDKQIAAYRRKLKNERRRARRGRPRSVYLANSLSATKPWKALGMSRRTWYRRRGTTRGPLAEKLLSFPQGKTGLAGPSDSTAGPGPVLVAPCGTGPVPSVRVYSDRTCASASDIEAVREMAFRVEAIFARARAQVRTGSLTL